MNRRVLAIVPTVILTSSALQIRPLSATPARAGNNSEPVIIAAGKPTVTDGSLAWRYQIRNDSPDDVWICDSIGAASYQAYLAEDDETLLIQRRLDLPAEGSMGEGPGGIYSRLRSGDTRTEVMFFNLPILPKYAMSARREQRPLEYATRLVLEIGYYVGDLPAMVVDMLRQVEMKPQTYSSGLRLEQYHPSYFFGGMWNFIYASEDCSPNRSEGTYMSYTFQTFKGERVLRVRADGLRIPYLEDRRPSRRPDLRYCTRIDTRFRQSPLEFFFPYADEQSLLSPGERQHLRSLDTITIQDGDLLKAFSDDVSKGLRGEAFVAEHGVAELACYRGDERLVSLTVYDGAKMVDEKGQAFKFPQGLPRLREFVREVQPLDLRVQCASHLESLWYRLHVCHKTGAKVTPRRWCDDMAHAFRSYYGWSEESFSQVFKCPSRPRGKSRYAMNPDCRPGSQADTVLLFETKAGWNQHGGPELFTFDNHDPRGGLVLLNDGTVKFIRTEEELKRLRWK